MDHNDDFKMKPPVFSGDEDQWTEWSFVMRAYLSPQTEAGALLVDAAEENSKPAVSLQKIKELMGPAGVAASRKVFFSLTMTLKSFGMSAIRNVEPNNGAAAWRALRDRYEPQTIARTQSIMTAILNVSQFPGTFDRLRAEVRRLGDKRPTIREFVGRSLQRRREEKCALGYARRTYAACYSCRATAIA